MIFINFCRSVKSALQQFLLIFVFRYIKFTQSINFGEQNKNFGGINFFFGKYGAYEFNCNYKQSLRTEAVSFQPLVEERPINERRLEQFLTWDTTLEIEFFDSSFENKMDPSTLYLGSIMHFQAIWTTKFTDKFPVEFHLNSCSIRDKTSKLSFDMIKDGCAADIIWTSLLSMQAYQRERVSWSYRSFQFDKDEVKADMTLDCEIAFCLTPDRITGKCKTSTETCASGYSKPTPAEIPCATCVN